MKQASLIVFAFLLLVSCEKPASQPDTIVVEGRIEAGKHPVIHLHKAIRLSEKEIETEEMFRQSLILTAQIFVSDGTDSVQLIGKINRTTLPPYYYYSVDIKGQAGKTYTLNVNYKGQQLTASTTIPSVIPIDSIEVRKVNARPENREVIVHFTDNAATTDYYALFYCLGKQTQYVLASLGIRDDRSQQGQHIAWRLNRSNTLLDNSKDFDFAVGDTVNVKLSHIDADSYSFWTSLASTSTANTWLFMPKAQIGTNINGGLGCWCGYGSNEQQLFITERDTTLVYTEKL